MKTNHLKSETAKTIAKYYFNKYGNSSIFDDANEVENAIDLAIRRGAIGRQITNEVINFLKA